jgi:hypothetical protein
MNKKFLVRAGRAPPFFKKDRSFFVYFEKKKQKTFMSCAAIAGFS